MNKRSTQSAEWPATGADAAETRRLLRLATHASVGTAGALIIAKLAAWLLTGSVSVLASLVDSAMDAGASLVNLLAVRWSLAPPDAKHRFGHGKAQALAALGQAAFISGSAGFLLLEAVNRLVNPRPVAEVGIGLAVIAFGMIATIVLLTLQHHVIRRTNSPAIRADALHYATDLATNTATLMALALTWLGWGGSDAVFALGIGAYILYSAVRIALEAIGLLMDQELPEPQRKRIAALLREVPGVLGMHDLRTRQSGHTVILQCHLELDGRLSLEEAHSIGRSAEAAILAHYPDADMLIHHDPVAVGTAATRTRAPSGRDPGLTS